MKRRPRSRAISPARAGAIPSKSGRPRSLRGSTPTQPSSAAKSRKAAKPSFGAVFWFNAKSIAVSLPSTRGSGVPLHDPLDLRGRDEAPLPQRTCHDVQVVHLEPMRRAGGMMAPGDKHDIAVPDSHRLIQRYVIGVDPLDAKPVARIQAVIVGFLQVGDPGKIVLVVPVARIG